MLELLTPVEMGIADRLAIAGRPYSGIGLMRNAGLAISREILTRYPEMPHVDVLCGPGNNGGDGYVAAGELARAGVSVAIHAMAAPGPDTDAALAASACGMETAPLEDFSPSPDALVVDALFGAGLERPLHGTALAAVGLVEAVGCKAVAVDLPSGLSGKYGKVLGGACPADLTVTFFRKKPGHLLYPGRKMCGELVLADIGIPDRVLGEIGATCFENLPELWRVHLPIPEPGVHKHSRGAAGVFSGSQSSTGAARLAAMAAQRAGAGAVTVYSPGNALAVNASHLTSIMLARLDTADDVAAMLRDSRCRTFILGPGFGVGQKARDFVTALIATDPDRLSGNLPRTLVLDADGLTSFAGNPTPLFERPNGTPDLVLTPHEGEFCRLFPDLADDESLSKLERARSAAERAGAVVVHKGPDTVIAAPDGRAAINTNGSPRLATAGSGDVLAGVIAGLAAQQMPAFEAACAGAWLHGETGNLAGCGAIAEDLIRLLPAAFAELV